MMRVFDKLNDTNFRDFAIRNYDNPHCLSIQEFDEDIARFKYIKRLLKKYQETGEIKERLVLNHLIVLYNVFPIQIANRMLMLKMEKELWPALKSFLIFLSYLPDGMMMDVPADMFIAKKLQSI